MAGIFKAYDIRGTYPDQIHERIAGRIGSAVVKVLNAKRLVIGRDMRESGPSLRDAIVAAVLAAGCEVIDIGRCSTPMLYFAVNSADADGGIMITASHNPARYNGCKICGRGATPVSYDTGIADIERLAAAEPTGTSDSVEPGRLETREIADDYYRWLLERARDLPPFTLAIDTGNGIMGEMLPRLFEKLPCRVIPLYWQPDGRFPNHEPDPLKPENMRDLQAAVREHRADLGIAFDGDGDRVMFVDERQGLVSSDRITALFAGHFLAQAPGSTIIYDLRSSWVVRDEIQRHGGTPLESRVGHSFIKQSMRKTSAVFAGELSGHFYFRDAFYTDNGELAMLTLLSLLSQRGEPLSQLLSPFDRYFATGELNFEVADKQTCLARLQAEFKDAEVSHLDGVTLRYADWWCNVRPSNTEPVLRLNLEAKTPALRDQMTTRVESLLGKRAH
jgi:phosphomannomutase